VSGPRLRAITPPGANETLGELIARLWSTADDALAEGRVFVDGRRTTDSALRLAPGSVVEVHASRAPSEGIALLGEHAGLVFVNKPAGVATEPDHAGIAGSLVERVAQLLGVTRAELHAVSRLDVGVSGVVTLARSEAGRRLAAELRARGGFSRRYVALAPKAPEPAEGSWDAPLPRRLRAPSERAGDTRSAVTRYAVVARAGSVFLPMRGGAPIATSPALLALSPVTGRTHQLRLHAAGAGVALLGDAAHGGAPRLVLPNGSVRALERVYLHAAWVELELGRERLRVDAPSPDDFSTLWAELGGAPDAWPRALEIAFAGGRG
jgi:23S rRNA-/tRNA-specific pseudouridylate synthase